MTRGDEERVRDMLDACHRLAEIAALGRAEYDRSWMHQSAAERQLEIIGQAANHLSDEVVAANPDLPVKQAKGLRNVIAHEYFRVNHDRVWNGMVNRVPELVAVLSRIRIPEGG